MWYNINIQKERISIMDELEKNKIKYHEARVKFNKLNDILKKI